MPIKFEEGIMELPEQPKDKNLLVNIITYILLILIIIIAIAMREYL